MSPWIPTFLWRNHSPILTAFLSPHFPTEKPAFHSRSPAKPSQLSMGSSMQLIFEERHSNFPREYLTFFIYINIYIEPPSLREKFWIQGYSQGDPFAPLLSPVPLGRDLRKPFEDHLSSYFARACIFLLKIFIANNARRNSKFSHNELIYINGTLIRLGNIFSTSGRWFPVFVAFHRRLWHLEDWI